MSGSAIETGRVVTACQEVIADHADRCSRCAAQNGGSCEVRRGYFRALYHALKAARIEREIETKRGASGKEKT